MVVLNDHILTERFHGEYLAIVLLLHKEDFSKRSSSNDFLNLEVGQTDIGITSLGEGGTMHTRLRWQIIILHGEWTSWGFWLEGLVDVLVSLPVRVCWQSFNTTFDIFLGGLVLLDLAWDHVNWQVGVHHMEVACLNMFKKFIS